MTKSEDSTDRVGEIKLPIKLVSSDALVPSYLRSGDAACDLSSTIAIQIEPGKRALIPTGICLEIPPGYGGFILPRSGLALRYGVTCLNAPGLIDSGYRGEVKVILHNSDQLETFDIVKGARVAQLMIVKVPLVEFQIVDTLTESERGLGGFGHTGR